jgi:hypothetical protein
MEATMTRPFRASFLPLLSALALAACGGDDPSGPGGTPWVGSWELTLENGAAPSGYSSELTIQASSFTSTFSSPGQSCSWTGTLSATATQITWNYNSASGPPCTTAVGTSRTSTWTLSSDGDTLTLNFTGSGGTLQVWSRI